MLIFFFYFNKPSVLEVSKFDEATSCVNLSLPFIEQGPGVELKLWEKKITQEDLNIEPVQYEHNQTLVGLKYPGREHGPTASYTF